MSDYRRGSPSRDDSDRRDRGRDDRDRGRDDRDYRSDDRRDDRGRDDRGRDDRGRDDRRGGGGHDDREACYDFSVGKCQRGSSCRYSHDGEGGGGGGDRRRGGYEDRDRGRGRDDYDRRDRGGGGGRYEAPRREQVGKRDIDTSGSSQLFIGNLPYDIDERDLEDIFGKFGKVEITLKRSPDGQCRGFGFLKFEDSRDAEDAHKSMFGQQIKGRTIKLDFDAGKSKKEDAGFLRPSRSQEERPRSPPRERERSRSRSPPRHRSPQRSPPRERDQRERSPEDRHRDDDRDRRR